MNSKTTCAKCKAPDCMNYITLIKSLDGYAKATGTDLDVFLEAVAPADPKSETSKRELLRATLEDAKVENLRIYNVRKEFGAKTLFHKGSEAQRYHYMDIRFGPAFQVFGFHIGVILQGTAEMRAAYRSMFQLAYPTPKKLLDTILHMCFSKRMRYPVDNSGLPIQSKIAKQVYKLPKADQQIVRAFFTEHFKQVMRRFNYQAGGDEFLGAVFWLSAGMMDIYTMSRLLFYLRKQPTGSTSVVFAGAGHTVVYSDFLKKWGANLVEEVQYSPTTLLNPKRVEKLSRCITRRARRKRRD